MKYRKSLLVSAFESFYLLIKEVQKQIEGGAFFNVNDTAEEKDEKVAAMQNRLYLFIKEKDAQIAYENGKLAVAAFEEVIYAMVALADEIFLSMEWEGKIYWRTHLFEQKFFNTSCAGEQLLINLDQFLRERNAQDSEIGLVYLYVLALGFKGKLRYEEDIDFYLRSLKEQVFYAIYRKSPRLYQTTGSLFPQTAENIFIEKFQYKDNSMRDLMKIGIGMLCGYLLISHILWHVETKPTWKLLAKLKEDMVPSYVHKHIKMPLVHNHKPVANHVHHKHAEHVKHEEKDHQKNHAQNQQKEQKENLQNQHQDNHQHNGEKP